MNDTIHKVQGFSKAVRIIAKITWVASLVGLIISACAIVYLAVAGDLTATYSIGSVTVAAPVAGDAVTAMTFAEQAGFLSYCVALLSFTMGIAGRCGRLFGNMETQPSPFTMENADILRRLGVLMILAAVIPTIVGEGVGMTAAVTMGVSFNGDYGSGYGLLAALILFALSVVFRYGCELQTQVDETL